MRRPKRLKQGDRVGVVAPAGPVDRTTLEKGLRMLRQMGFCPVLSENIHAKDRYLAGTDAQRTKDLHDFLETLKSRVFFVLEGVMESTASSQG